MHRERTSRVGTPRVVLGICLIALGVLFTLENFGFRDIWAFWPVLLVVVGLSKLLWPASPSSRRMGVVVLAIGVILLLDENHLGVIELDFWDLFPLIFVLVGISILWRGLAGREAACAPREEAAEVNAVAILGGSRRTSTSDHFRGGDLIAFMGGVEVDLTGASTADGTAVIDAFAFWGGVDIRVPADWTVTMRGVPLLGGYADNTTPPTEPAGRLVVKGFAIMGAVEVKN